MSVRVSGHGIRRHDDIKPAPVITVDDKHGEPRRGVITGDFSGIDAVVGSDEHSAERHKGDFFDGSGASQESALSHGVGE